MLDHKTIQKLKLAFSKNRSIKGAYIFGTYAVNKVNPESDFDLAVVVKDMKKISLDRVYSLVKDCSFPRDLDLTVVDQSSSPLLLYEIVKNGKRIYTQNEMQSTDFEAEALYKYYDTAHLRNIYFSYLSDKFSKTRYANQ